jgi:hypothetical protein
MKSKAQNQNYVSPEKESAHIQHIRQEVQKIIATQKYQKHNPHSLKPANSMETNKMFSHQANRDQTCKQLSP